MSDYEKDKQRRKILQKYVTTILTPYIGGTIYTGMKVLSGKKLYWGDVLKEYDIPTEYLDEVKQKLKYTCMGGGIKFIEGESGFFKNIFK